MASAAVRFKTVVLLLFMHCLLLLPLFMGVLCLVLVLLCSTLCSSLAKRELVALLVLSSGYYVIVLYLVFTVPWDGPLLFIITCVSIALVNTVLLFIV